MELRYFGGLSVDEAAEYLKIAPATVHRYWAYARAWRIVGEPNSRPARSKPRAES